MEVFYKNEAVFKNFVVFAGNTCIRGLKVPAQVFSLNIAKFLGLFFSKNICEQLLFDCSNGSLLNEPKISKSRFYGSVKLQGLQVFSESSGSSSQRLSSRTEFRPVFKNQRAIPLMSQLSFLICYFWLF